MLQRDGRDSGVSVTMYRSLDWDPRAGSILKSFDRKLFNGAIASSEALESSGTNGDRKLSALSEDNKQVLTVVKRGREVDISDVGPVEHNGLDLREWTKDLAWPQLKKQQSEIEIIHDDLDITEEMDTDFGGDEDAISSVTDVYNDLEEYPSPWDT